MNAQRWSRGLCNTPFSSTTCWLGLCSNRTLLVCIFAGLPLLAACTTLTLDRSLRGDWDHHHYYLTSFVDSCAWVHTFAIFCSLCYETYFLFYSLCLLCTFSISFSIIFSVFLFLLLSVKLFYQIYMKDWEAFGNFKFSMAPEITIGSTNDSWNTWKRQFQTAPALH